MPSCGRRRARAVARIKDPGARLAGAQAQRAGPSASQRGAHYFGNYARALLSPLPKKSLLLINYDQQWTSIRCDAGAARRRGTFRVRAGPNSTHPRAQVHASV